MCTPNVTLNVTRLWTTLQHRQSYLHTASPQHAHGHARAHACAHTRTCAHTVIRLLALDPLALAAALFLTQSCSNSHHTDT